MDTRVYPYKNNCQQYGHSKNRCNRNMVCGKCGGENHLADNCLESQPCCLHCKCRHRVKDKTCSRQIQEEAILSIRDKFKVRRRKVRQIHERVDETSRPQEGFATHFLCRLDETKKRQISPWMLEKCLQQ